MTPSVSACVIARDEEDQIERCLASLAWVDECVVVVDERSTDGTFAIARRLGARVLRHPYEGNIQQKNHAIEQLKGDWVVALDADEALSPALARDLQARIAAAPDDLAGIELCRVTFHLGRWLRHGDFHPDWQLRAFRRAAGRFAGRNPHGRVRVDGGVEQLAGDLEHRSYRDLADQLERIGRFSVIEAAELHRAGRRAGASDLVLRPPARWLRAVVLKRGYRDGIPGLVVAGMTAFHVFLKYAQLWVLSRRRGSAGSSSPSPASRVSSAGCSSADGG